MLSSMQNWIRRILKGKSEESVWSHFKDLDALVETRAKEVEKPPLLAILDEMRNDLGGDVETPKLVQRLIDAAKGTGIQEEVTKKAQSLIVRIRKDEEDKEGTIVSFGRLVIGFMIGGFTVGLGTIYYFSVLTGSWFGSPDVSHATSALDLSGKFADSFGIITAMFSAAAFAGVIYTILLQRKELALQREEVRLARREAAKSADALEKQVVLTHQSAIISGLNHTIQNLDIRVRGNDSAQGNYWLGQREYFSELMEHHLFLLLKGGPDPFAKIKEKFADMVNSVHSSVIEKWNEEKNVKTQNHENYASACKASVNYIAKSLGKIQGFTEFDGKARRRIDREVEKLKQINVQITNLQEFTDAKIQIQNVINSIPTISHLDPESA